MLQYGLHGLEHRQAESSLKVAGYCVKGLGPAVQFDPVQFSGRQGIPHLNLDNRAICVIFDFRQARVGRHAGVSYKPVGDIRVEWVIDQPVGKLTAQELSIPQLV